MVEQGEIDVYGEEWWNTEKEIHRVKFHGSENGESKLVHG